MITQGTWEVSKKTRKCEYGREYLIITKGCIWSIGEVFASPQRDQQEVEDNAKLIASAPATKKQRDDLLNALKAIRDKLGGITYYPAILAIAQKAIVAAESEA